MSPARYEVVDVGQHDVSGSPFWYVDQQGPEQYKTRHSFPLHTLQARAAEYGFDPHDSPALLDVILHERFMTHQEMHHENPDFVYNTDRDTARAAHLERVAVAKGRGVVLDPSGLLGRIHDAHRVDEEFMRAAHAHVDRIREDRSNRNG